MEIRSWKRQVIGCALLMAALGSVSAAWSSDDPVRLTRKAPGESVPVTLDADEIATWTEGDWRIILLRGQVLVQQGTVRTRCQAGVIFLDLKRFRTARIWDIDFHAEGEVTVQSGADTNTGPNGRIQLHTTGEMKLNAHRTKVLQEARTGDPLYRRSLEARGQSTPVSPITPVQFQQPGTPPITTPELTVPDLPPLPGMTPGLPPLPGAAGAKKGPTGPLFRDYRILPRNRAGFNLDVQYDKATKQSALVGTGGFLISGRVFDATNRTVEVLDIEADHIVVWTTGDPQKLAQGFNSGGGMQTNQEELEFYLSGNVEIRARSGPSNTILRAEEAYHDARRKISVAVGADLEMMEPGLLEPVHFKASEIEQLSETRFQALQGEFFASRLPSDPGLRVTFARATLENRTRPRRSALARIFGLDLGSNASVRESLIEADNVYFKVEDVPVFYLPRLKGDARDPLGPVQSIHLGANRIYGTQVGVGLDMYDLLGLDPIPGTRWRMDVDYLSRRGPALGMNYDFFGKDLFAQGSQYTGQIRAWGLYDDASDILGGGRGELEHHPNWRGRADLKGYLWDLPYGFSIQGQVVGLSDKNLLEQFFKREFDEDPNKESYLYLRQTQDNWAWSVLGEGRLRNWVTETEWLPRVDGYLIGQSFFDLLSYNAHASAGYARLMPAHTTPPPFVPTDGRAETGRFDFMQELSVPFQLGPVKVVPYGLLDLTYYTEDRQGEGTGRALGGGGLRASLPLNKVYSDAQSLLLNVNGLQHKIVLGGNYYYSDSTDRYSRFPQLDRLDDDATDQARRDLRPILPVINPRHGAFLATSPLFDPQLYAIRRGVLDRVDTLDHLEVLQLELRQRLQTRRGFPGNQHIVDWMSLELSGSIFPRKDRDNFGQTLSFLEYDWEWNVGDRTALYSTGWFDPIDNGPRVFSIGAALNRTDRTTYSIMYRLIEPVGSHAVTGAFTYVLSPKYAFTATSMYDFGTNQALSNSLVLTRMGTDLQVSLGLSYNALQKNLGFTFEIIPNLVSPRRRMPGLGVGPGLFGR